MLDKFSKRLLAEAGRNGDEKWLAGWDIAMYQLLIIERRGGNIVDNNDNNGGEERQNLLGIRITQRPLTLWEY